jgi:hypothetical protein
MNMGGICRQLTLIAGVTRKGIRKIIESLENLMCPLCPSALHSCEVALGNITYSLMGSLKGLLGIYSVLISAGLPE